MIEEILEALRPLKSGGTERELHRAVEAALTAAGIQFEPECELGSPKDRIDFLAQGVGIECKVSSARGATLRQCTRYAAHLDDIILLTLWPMPFGSGDIVVEGRSCRLHVVELWKNLR